MTALSRSSTFQLYDCLFVFKVEIAAGLSPLSKVNHRVLAERENDIAAAWQLDVGHELASENSPLAHVVLVVEELCALVVAMPWEIPSL